MSKLAITAIATVAISCMMIGNAFASPLTSATSSLVVTAAMSCGCKKDCCEKKCCEPKCCKPKCCKPKCCEPKCCEPCCKKKKCCPAVPEYPMVCEHNHGEMERDRMSRHHAPWWNPREMGR